MALSQNPPGAPQDPAGTQSEVQAPVDAPSLESAAEGAAEAAAAERRRLEALAADEQAAEEIRIKESLALTDAARKAFDASEQGQIAAENAEVERIMRLPTPEAVIASGQHPGDPTKGPSS